VAFPYLLVFLLKTAIPMEKGLRLVPVMPKWGVLPFGSYPTLHTESLMLCLHRLLFNNELVTLGTDKFI